MIINLLRDQLHVDPGANQPGFSSQNAAGSTIKMNSSGIVNQTFGSVSLAAGSFIATSSASSWRGVGLLMSQPIIDATPYRVKARILVHNAYCWVFCGYAPASPTGTDDTITGVVAWPLGVSESSIFDDIILFPAVPAQSALPLAFGIAAAGTGNANARYNLSVQNVAKTAPQFAASMS